MSCFFNYFVFVESKLGIVKRGAGVQRYKEKNVELYSNSQDAYVVIKILN